MYKIPSGVVAKGLERDIVVSELDIQSLSNTYHWEKYNPHYLELFPFCSTAFNPIYQPFRSGRIWHKVNF